MGVGLARLGKKVLLVDADPQGDLTTCLGWRDNDSLTTTITDKLSGVIGIYFTGVGLVDLATIKEMLAIAESSRP